MITPVSGKNAFLYVQVASVYKLTVCARSLGIDIDVEDIETSTKDTGTDTYYKPGYSSATVTADGLGTIDSLSRYQFYDFIDNRRVIHQCKIVFTNSFGDILQYEFKAKVQRVSPSADVKGFLASSVVLKVCGPLTKTILYDHILVDIDLDPILDTDGNLIRTP